MRTRFGSPPVSSRTLDELRLDHLSREYLVRVSFTVGEILGRRLAGLWLAGSAVLGDYDASRSDLDVIGVTTGDLPAEASRALSRRLVHDALPCPALGLDLVLYASPLVPRPEREPHAALGLTTGREWPLDVTVNERNAAGLIDLAIARDRGVALFGADSEAAIGSIPAEWLREEVARTVEWHARHIFDPFHDPGGRNAVLNAARAWRYLETGELGSKRAAGDWAAHRAEDFAWLLAIALNWSRHQEPLPRDGVEAFLARISSAQPTTPA